MSRVMASVKSIPINIDFDGTVVTHEFPQVGKSIGAEPVLQELVEAGHRLILFTMRSDDQVNEKTGKTVLQDAVDWFADRGLPLWGVQTNPEQHTWTSSPKSYAPLMIDDSALGIPLKPPNKYMSHRSYVDWVKVRMLLVERGLLDGWSQGKRGLHLFVGGVQVGLAFPIGSRWNVFASLGTHDELLKEFGCLDEAAKAIEEYYRENDWRWPS